MKESEKEMKDLIARAVVLRAKEINGKMYVVFETGDGHFITVSVEAHSK